MGTIFVGFELPPVMDENERIELQEQEDARVAQQLQQQEEKRRAEQVGHVIVTCWSM